VVINETEAMQGLWDHIAKCQLIFQGYMDNKWVETKTNEMEEEVKREKDILTKMNKVDKKSKAYLGLLDEAKKWMQFLPLINGLRDEAMRERHWDIIREKVNSNFVVDDKLTLKEIYDLNLGKIADDVEEVAEQAKQESRMENKLEEFEKNWKDVEFEFEDHKKTGVMKLKMNEETFEMLEENQTQVTAMFGSRYLATFEELVVTWQKNLASISEVVVLCQEVTRLWSFLEMLFIHSEEVKKELPRESEQFKEIDKDVKKILADAFQKKIALNFCSQDWVLPDLEKVQ
jgi:dynein heavy chain